MNRQTFEVILPCSLPKAWAFHENPGALQLLLPPWEDIRLLRKVGGGLHKGKAVPLSIKKFGLRFEMQAEHVLCEPPHLFVDTLVRGPFSHWEHRHEFSLAGDGCRLVDRLEWSLPLPLRLGAKNLESEIKRQFDYRHRVTRHWLNLWPVTKPMRIALSGSSGLVGGFLSEVLTNQGHEILRLKRRPSEGEILFDWESGRFEAVALEGVDAVIHLAGESVAQFPWTVERKKLIHDSRIKSTKLLAQGILSLHKKPETVICASATGYYGSRQDEELSESSGAGEGFLAETAQAWEGALQEIKNTGIRTTMARFGVILSQKGGALSKMIPPFLAGMGGPIGSGQQWMPLISLEDAVGALVFILHNPKIEGALNLCCPEPLRQGDFARLLGQSLNRPSLIRAPEAAIRMLAGSMGEEMLLASTRALPHRLQESGYSFLHKTAAEILQDSV